LDLSGGTFLDTFNWIDLVLILGLLAGLFTGLGLGFYRQAAMLLALAGGLVLASRFTVDLSRSALFQPVGEQFGIIGSEMVAFGTILLSCIGLALLGMLIFRSFFDRTLKLVDALIGGAMGVALSAFLFGILILAVFQWTDTRLHRPIRESVLGSRIAEGTRVLVKIFPEEFQYRVDASLDPTLPPRFAGAKELEPGGDH